MKITLNKVKHFISKDLPAQLERDLRDLKIVKEADLECCFYYHLRQLVNQDKEWRIFARKYSPQTKHYHDLLLFRKKIPRICVELKWKKKKIAKKDKKSLNRSLSNLGVNKAYFFTTTIGNSRYQKVAKTKAEKRKLKEIAIELNLCGKKLDWWKKERKCFTSKMAYGKKAFAS